MNEGNLIVLSPSEARENGRKGGIKSGEARRRKSAMRTAMKQLLSLPVQDMETWNALAAMGVEPEQMDNQTALLASVLAKGIRTGDFKALLAVAAIAGEDNDAERLKLQKRELAAKEKNRNGDDGMLSDVLAVLQNSSDLPK